VIKKGHVMDEMSDGIYCQSPLALALENNCSFSIWNELWWNILMSSDEFEFGKKTTKTNLVMSVYRSQWKKNVGCKDIKNTIRQKMFQNFSDLLCSQYTTEFLCEYS
jgi:hypothetical protein